MVGFCNGLAIVIGLAQLHPFHDKEKGEGSTPSGVRSFQLEWKLKLLKLPNEGELMVDVMVNVMVNWWSMMGELWFMIAPKQR